MSKNRENQPDLNPEQREAVAHGKGPLLISAGAGSGKTRTLTQRLIKLIESGVGPEKIVAITFTNKAAQEIRNRVGARIGDIETWPFLGTFHSLGAKILRNEHPLVGRGRNFVIYDNDDSMRVIKKVLKDLDISDVRFPAPKVQKKVSFIKDELISRDELEEPINFIFDEYERRLMAQNSFDFDDLIEKVVRLFRKNESTLDKYQNMFEYILVDEFQDINTSQYALVRLLAQNHKNLNVVGDANQSIYGFRGADFRNFLNFEKDWPEAKIVHLGENYRSTKNIVNAAAEVIKNNNLQRPKKLWTSNDPGEPVKVLAAQNAEDEAMQIISDIIANDDGKPTAIIYRTNAQSRALEQALNLDSIPYDIFGGLKFYDRKEIKDIMAGLKYGFNPQDVISLERLIKTFRKDEGRELKEQLPEFAKTLTPIELIGFFMKTVNYESHLQSKSDNPEERMDNIVELINFASNFQTLQEFIEKVSLLDSAENTKSPERKSAVKLMTIHLSKGLEFDNVYLAGVNEGVLPHERSLLTKNDLEEERRLMYVAMTRARHKLTLSFYGHASRFLYEIPPEFINFSGPRLWTDDEDEIHLI